MLLWIWVVVIMVVAFQTSLFHGFLQARFHQGIKTIKNLKESGMKIYLHAYYAHHENFNHKNFTLWNQYVISDPDSMNISIHNRETNAYILSQDLAKMYINQFIKNKSHPFYEIADEIFIPGLRVFHLQKNSPFLEKVNEVLLLVEQFGLWRKEMFCISDKQFQDSIMVDLTHLGFVFTMYLYGNMVAVFAFICELVWKKI